MDTCEKLFKKVEIICGRLFGKHGLEKPFSREHNKLTMKCSKNEYPHSSSAFHYPASGSSPCLHAICLRSMTINHARESVIDFTKVISPSLKKYL